MTVDWAFIVSPRMIEAVLAGARLTVIVSVASAFAALVIGMGLAVLASGRNRFGRRIADGYVACFRNVPLLVVLFFLYFGLPGLLSRRSFPFLYGQSYEIWISIAAVTLVSAAFVAEVLRAGIEAVPAGQSEAAAAIGLNFFQRFRLVVLPQLLPIVLPGLSNEAINVVKNSTYGMTIGLTELIWQAQQIEAETFKGFEAMTAVTIAFLVLNGMIFVSFAGLERLSRVS